MGVTDRNTIELRRWTACLVLFVSVSNGQGNVERLLEPDPPPTVKHGSTLVWTEESAGSGTMGRVQVVGIAGDPAQWITSDNLRIIGDVKTPTVDDTHYSSRIAVGFRYSTQELFWSDIGFKEIHKTKLTSPQSSTGSPPLSSDGQRKVDKIYSGTSQQVNGLAVDWLSGSVYWTDALYNWITVAANDKYDIFRHLVLTGLDKPMGIVVHPILGKMYWCDWGAVPKIEVANLDGSNRATLIDSRLDRPLGMALDYETNILFWVDDFLDTIDEYDLATGIRKTWSTSGGSPVGPASFFGIALYQNFIFVTDQQYQTVRTFNRTTHEHIHNIFLGRTPYDIIMYHESRQKSYSSECATLSCEHMCVSMGDGRGKCICSHGYTLIQSNGTCVENGRLGDPMYVYSVGASICGTPINLADREFVQLSEDVHCFVKGSGSIGSMAADVNSGSIFYADENAIYRFRLIEGATSDVISVQTGKITGMAVDWLSSNLYYSGGDSGMMMIQRLEGRYPTVLCRGLGSTRGITLDPALGKMYWVDISQSLIWESDMACNNQRPLVHRVIEGTGITFDPHEKRLYWTQRSGILSVNLRGGDKRTIINDFSQTYTDVAIYQDYFAWSDGRNGIFFGEKGSARVLRGFRHRETNVSGDVLGYSSYQQPVSEGPCDVQNGGCSQICVPVHSSNKCLCAIGFVLAADQTTCVSDLQRGRFLLFVDPYHKEVYQLDLLQERPIPQGIGLTTPEFPSTISMDVLRERMYWADDHAGVIRSVPLLGGQEESALHVGTEGVVASLAVIGRSGHVILSWKDRTARKNAIYVSDLNGANKVMFENVTYSSRIAVDERNTMVYWADMVDGAWVIYQRPVEPRGQSKRLVWSGPDVIKDMAISQIDDKLYWCTEKTIWRSGLRGENDTMVYEANYDIFISMSVTKDYVYFSSRSSKSLMRLDIQSWDVQSVTEPLFSMITDIKEYYHLPPREKPSTTTKTFSISTEPPGSTPRVLAAKDDFLKHGVPMPVVLGAGVGVVVLVAVIVALACWLSRRSRHKQPSNTVVVTGTSHDNPTYVTTELVGDTVYEGLAGATSGTPSRDSTDLPDIVLTQDGIPMKAVQQSEEGSSCPPPLPTPRAGSTSSTPRPEAPPEAETGGDQQVDRFIFPLDSEQLVVQEQPDSDNK